MRTIDNFDLSKLEIMRVERAANNIGGRITDWHTDGIVDPEGYIKVLFAISCEGGVDTIALQACVSDCRKSYVLREIEGYTLTTTDLNICREWLDRYLPGVVAPDAEYEIAYIKGSQRGAIYTTSINGHRIELGYRIIPRRRKASFVADIRTGKAIYNVCCEETEVVEAHRIRDILYDADAILYDKARLMNADIINKVDEFVSKWIMFGARCDGIIYKDGKYILPLVCDGTDLCAEAEIDESLSLDTFKINTFFDEGITPLDKMIESGLMPAPRAVLIAKKYMDDLGVPYDYCAVECTGRNFVDVLISKGAEYRATITVRFEPQVLYTWVSLTGLLVSNTLIEDHGLKSWDWKSVDNSWSEVIECKKSILRIIYGAVIVNESFLNKQAYPRLLLRTIGYSIVKCSCHMGYVRLGAEYYTDYSGRYGEGFVEHSASGTGSTRYHTITYWIKK